MRERYRSILRSLAVMTMSAFAVACGAAPADAASSEELKQPATLSSCTARIEGTNGKACSKEGLACSFVFACDSFTQLARCTCESARFNCTDSTGHVAPGSSPQCVKNAPPSVDVCPSTMNDASGAPCDTLGRSCFYEGDLCPNSPLPIRPLDYCQCARSPSGTLTYACRQAVCSPLLAN